MNISMRFDIDAGRYEDQGEKNYKYCDSADTIEEALAKWHACEGYDFAEMELVVDCDGAQSRIAIFGGQDEETWMRMRIAGLWMKAMNKSFADIAASWEEQLDEIESEISLLRKHNGALRQQNERAHKRVEELEARRTFIPWTVVHAQFSNGLLTWTEAFDALMSQCGMPMEEALSCLAENFDRRPAITAEEV